MYKTVQYKIELSSKFGGLKSNSFLTKCFVLGFNESRLKFWPFCMNDSEQNEAKTHIMLKNAPITGLNPPHHPF
jgi:hypothetical protein